MSKRRRISLAPLSALAALAGCSLAVDLDSLSARRQPADAAAPADATTDTAPLDRGALDRPPVAPGDLDAASSSVDVALDIHAPEDRPEPVVEDAAGDRPSTPDATAGYEVAPGDDGGANAPPPPAIDAAPTVDGPSADGRLADGGIADGPSGDVPGVDGGSDAPPLCRRLSSHRATLYLTDGTSAATGCGYARSGLSGYLATVDPTTFDGSAACGACLRVETAAGAVVAQVVEQGPSATPANPTAIAVNRAALRTLLPDGSTFADQGVSWRFVPCPLPADSGMTFLFQEGSNTSYAALLIEGHRFRLASVEYRSNGSYRSLTRASYNYWVASSGMGGGPFTLRVTDVHGHSVEQAGVPLKPGVVFQGQVQFPECASE